MQKSALRIVIYAMLFTLMGAIIVAIIGLILGWKTSTQFSDGFFWAGAILILFGFISLRGYGYHSTGWLPAKLDSADRARLWGADAFRGKILMAYLGISGLLLLGLSILVSRLF
jgi:hypothetical protein